MSNEESIVKATGRPSLEENKADRAAMAVKAVFGTVPFVGDLISEVVTSQIPNQKLERVILFLEVLAQKVDCIEQQVWERMKSPEGIDLIEDAINQSSKAESKERREYIANLLKNGLTDEESAPVAKKRIFRLFSELDDAEVLALMSHQAHLTDDDLRAFYSKHANLLNAAKLRAGQIDDSNPVGLFEDFRSKLISTGALDGNRGSITPLGDALLRYLEVE